MTGGGGMEREGQTGNGSLTRSSAARTLWSHHCLSFSSISLTATRAAQQALQEARVTEQMLISDPSGAKMKR